MASDPRHVDIEAKQRDYYDRIASVYDEHYGSDHGIAYRCRVFASLMDPHPVGEWRALDAMCGGGQNSVYFDQRGCDVVGLDISSEQCKHYQARLPDRTVHCASALDTPFDDDTFDLVFTDSLHHLPPKVDDGVRELCRILKPGGRLMVWEPAAGSVFDTVRKLWYRLDPSYFEDNEAAIDIEALAKRHEHSLLLERTVYGGNVGYLSVAMSMALRIPARWVDHYARQALWIEDKLTPLQSRATALWVLALFRKRADHA